MNEQINEIEISMEQAKSFVTIKNSLDKLYSNKDFKTVILNGYLKDEAIRAVLCKAHINHQDSESQNQLNKDIDAIGRLNEYFRRVFVQGQMAEQEIIQSLEALEEARNEVEGE